MENSSKPIAKTALLLQKLREKKGGAAAEPPRPAIPQADRSQPLPLSFAQERMWLLDQLKPGSSAFNMPFPLRLRGALDEDALERSLSELLRRHEVLRTVFPAQDGIPRQEIRPATAWKLARLDLTALPAAEREAAVTRLSQEDALAPFDLAAGPLYRGTLLRLSGLEHVLFLTFHHIVFDGWSTGVFFRELGQLLGAFGQGRPSPLPEPDLQYADFAVWQRRHLQGEALERDLAYWRGQLADLTPSLPLPTDRPRRPQGERRGAFEMATLPPALRQAVDAYAARHHATPFMVLIAVFQWLLGSMAGQDDVTVGTPVAGRLRRELESLVGCFLNTLILRARVDGKMTFAEHFAAVRSAALEATAHQETPIEKLLLELGLTRESLDAAPFQVLFNMANLPDLRLELPGLVVEMIGFEELGAKLDLNFYVFPTEQGLQLQVAYDADLFDRARIRELLRQYHTLLESVLDHPDRPLGEVSAVTRHARALLPDPQAELPNAWRGTIAAGFLRHAAEQPDHPAVVDDRATLSYAELAERSRRVAAALRGHGLERGQRVAIWAHRSAPLVEAMLGTLRAGGAFVMLDPAYPPSRVVDYLRLAEARFLIQLDAAGPLPAEVAAFAATQGIAILPLPAAGMPSADTQAPADDEAIGPDDLAYVAFTSGSTGLPKAVLGRHAPLTAFLPFLRERFALDGGDRHAMVSALSHDPLQRDVLMPLHLGATIVIPDGDALFSPGYLADWARRQGVTVLNLVPAMLQVLLADGPAPLPALRRVFTVGDVLKRADVDALYAVAPAATCINLYGSTETQRAVSFVVLPRVVDADPDSELGTGGLMKAALPVGRGYDGVQLVLLNAQGRQTGVGQVGEIHMRSHYLAAGYADPAQTAERFLANSFTQTPGDRMYRTGDLGRYLPDGQVEFLGRADFQVKIRGFRIELQEVEAALAAHPAVGDCVVVAREDGGAEGRPERRLVGYLVAREGEEAPSAAELRAFLGARLPDYMVPSAFVVLSALPLTQTGKLDRRALPAPETQAEEEVAYRAPRTAAEQEVASIMGALLGRERLGLDDNFFALGGHSLVATQLFARLRNALGVSLKLRDIFDAPTVEALAALVEGAAEEGPEIPAIRRVDRQGPLPLSFAQQRVWFLEQLQPGTSAYVLAGAVRLRGPLDVELFRETWSRLIQRHESLRTRIVDIDGEGHQVIEPALPVQMPVFDLSPFSEEEALRQAYARANAAARRPIDLGGASLLRTELIRLAPDDHVLSLAIHHLVADGWSVSILIRELGAIYRALAAGRPLELPPLPVQAADFASWEREWLRGELLDRQLGFWRRQLQGAPAALDLPTDHARPAMQSFDGERLEFRLPASVATALRKQSAELGATFFMTLMAAFQVFLAKLSGQQTIVVGTPVAHREKTELEGVIGFFANTLPIRLDLHGDPTFAEVVGRLRGTVLDAFAHQDLPFEKLVAEVLPQRDPSRSPIFQTMFALQNLEQEALNLGGGVTLEPFGVELRRAQFDLHWILYDPQGQESGADLVGYLDYATALFERSTAERWSARLLALLEGIAAGPARRLSELDPTVDADRRQIERNNATQARFDLDVPVHRLIEAQARLQPERVAVTFEGERVFSYGELDAVTNRLARHLRQLGAGAETLIGLSLGRRPSLVVAQLAILKSGAAYLPLDPVYPEDRLRYMFEDAGASILLIDSSSDPAPPALRAMARHIVDLADLRTFERYPAAPLDLPSDRHSLAYALYTSGSTGKPKGVLIQHGSLANFLRSMAFAPGLDADDRLLSVTTMSFDIAGLEIYLPLIQGARLDIASRESAVDGYRLGELMETCETTVLQATPATWRNLLESGWRGRPSLKGLCGGEALNIDLAERLLEKIGDLWNVYGPTETTIWSSARRVLRGQVSTRGESSVTLGRPIANTTIHLLDRSGRQVPPGVAGELCIGGDGLARGYHQRRGLSADRFVPDPFSAIPGARLYRTGDLARLRMDGELEFLGRLDFQVKVRGFRIELGEIEVALGKHPEIRQVVVVAQPGPGGDARLVAYAVPQPGSALEPEGLRAFLAESLAPHMVPTAFMLLDALPLTPNGKVDRKALPAFQATSTIPLGAKPAADVAPSAASQAVAGTRLAPIAAADTRLAPIAAADTRLAPIAAAPVAAAPVAVPAAAPTPAVVPALTAIWSEILGLAEIPADANFFTLGGHSLLATRLFARVADRIGVRLPLGTIFQKPTLPAMAALIEAELAKRQPAPAAQVASPVPAAGPASMLQAPAAPVAAPSAQTDVAAALAAIWAEVLGLAEIPADANFFTLGGHSLLATRLFARVADRIGVRLPLGTIFQKPTLPAMAAAIREHLGIAAPAQASAPPAPAPAAPAAPAPAAATPAPPAPAPVPAAAERPIEQELGAIWAEVLGLAEVPADANFFTLGGHSLLATRLFARVADRIGVRLPLGTIFQKPTLPAMAAMVRGELGLPAAGSAPVAPASAAAAPVTGPPVAVAPFAGGSDIVAEYPLSYSQERLWFLCQLEPEAATAYHIPVNAVVHGLLDLDLLGEALTQIVARHEVLRSSFYFNGDVTVQRVHRPMPIWVNVEDLDLPAEEAEEVIRPRALATIKIPFDLEKAPLLRAHAWRSGGKTWLSLVLHHLISDAGSFNVINDEMQEIFNARRQGRQPRLPVLTQQFGEFAAWQRSHLESGAGKADLDYWVGQLQGAPPLLRLPYDRPRPAEQRFLGTSLKDELGAQLSDAVRQLARNAGVTPYMVFLSAFEVLLSRLSGMLDIVVGTPITHRDRVETEQLVGFFVNNLALRVIVHPEEPFLDLVHRVRDLAIGAFSHQQIPFEWLVSKLQVPRDASFNPIFQVMFNYGRGANKASLDGLDLTAFQMPFEGTHFDLTWSIGDRDDGGVVASVIYSTSLFDQASIERFFELYRLILQNVVEQPMARVADLDRPRALAPALAAAVGEPEPPAALAPAANQVPAADPAPEQAAPVAVSQPAPATVSRPETPREYPLSYSQERVWFLSQLSDAASASYNMINFELLRGPLDIDRLRRALRQVVARHEILRTRFVTVDGVARQRVTPADEVEVEVEVIERLLPPSQRLAAAQKIAREIVGQPFDLERGPLLRTTLIKLAAEEHAMLSTFHHTIFDDGSAVQFLNEVAEVYAAEHEGRAPQLAPLTWQYGEYATYQRGQLSSAAAREDLEFWRANLAGAPPLLELPTDRPRPQTQSFRGGRRAMRLPAPVANRLRELGRRHHGTLFAPLLAAIKTLFWRLTGQRDMVIGTPISSRDMVEVERTLGFFVNTGLIRTQIAPRQSFRDLVAQIQASFIDALNHQAVPFEKLVEELDIERGAGFNPIFQTMMVLQQIAATPWGFADIRCKGISSPRDGSHFDLTFLMGDDIETGEIEVSIDYATDLFDGATIERWLDSLRLLIVAATDDPYLPIAELPLMPAPHRERVVRRYNATGRLFEVGGRRSTLLDLFEDQLARAPEADAVVAVDKMGAATTWSYRELSAHADAVAAELRRRGVEPGTPVAIAFPRSTWPIAAILGIFAVGGSYVPLDPGAPDERLRDLLAECGAPLLLTESGALDGRELGKAAVVAIDRLPPAVRQKAIGAAELPAYILFTSGSTGRPKGVVVTQQQAVHLTHAFVAAHGLHAGQRWLVVPPLYFDASVGDLFPALATGGALVFHAAPETLDGRALSSFCAAHGITVIDTAVALWKQWLDDWRASGASRVLPGLEVMMVGGESVGVDQLAAWRRLHDGEALLYNHYGPTEATVCATYYRTVDGSEIRRASLPIGQPLANVQAYVVDRELQPTPLGVHGELVIGGDGVALGYLQQPARTAEAFVPDPFSERPGGRLYRTGDLVRRLASGDLEFLGRGDRQVKIRGYRIELGEVESQIRRHPAVAETVVVAREDVPGQKRLAAYVKRDGQVDSSVLRAFLQDKLPPFMVPSAIVVLDAFPLTPNGKVDLRALPAPSEVESGPEIVAPRTATEEKLLTIWRTLLRTDKIGIAHDFFEAGGSSILVMQLANQIQQRFGKVPPLARLFEATVLSDQARLLEGDPEATAEVDFEAFAQLDPAIKPTPRPIAPPGQRSSLVTGGTGFLGAYLIDELLRQESGRVFVLVRASDPADGLARLRRNLQHYGLWREEMNTRMVPVLGELESPRLGMTAARFAELAGQLDVIYHNAALVNFLAPYGRLEAANVRGTEEALRLACLDGARHFHFISTLGVFLSGHWAGRVVTEDDDPFVEGLTHGYEQSKWVAERLVTLARERGLPAYIHRPARITGARRDGAANTGDLFYSLIKGCVQLGKVPDVGSAMDMLPVDILTRALVELAQTEDPHGRNYHYYNTATYQLDDLGRQMQKLGFAIELVPYGEWRQALQDTLDNGQDNALKSFAALFGWGEGDPSRHPVFDQQESQSRLRSAGIVFPPADDHLIRTYLTYLVRIGFLPKPTHSEA